ncbi:MAG: glutathione S-transferase [Pseudomonadota bacterium]
MTYTLYLGDRAYSSWSLRAWLIAEMAGKPASYRWVDFSGADVRTQLSHVAPARTVPTLVTPEGAIVSESLAIAEELASRFPEAGLWPEDPAARAIGRTLAAEMNTSFAALRDACPMNLRVAYSSYQPTAEVLEDLSRIETIWSAAQDATGGPWLCGAYSIADAFYAPVAMRIAGYGLPVGPKAQDYVTAHLAHLPFRQWRAMALAEGTELQRYKRDYETRAWPGPEPAPAEATEDGAGACNTRCPYSGEPVTHFLRFANTTYGFCNAFCRDKTVNDPEAWPAFTALLAAQAAPPTS